MIMATRAYISIFLLTISMMIIYAAYHQIVYIKKDRQDFITDDNLYSMECSEVNEAKFVRSKRAYMNMNKVRTRIKCLNIMQTIHNKYFGPITDDTSVIVIQCHSNVFLLKTLINSLRHTLLINSAFLIFSHDHYSYEMNKLISKIEFAKYMQIFYPYSIQLHRNVFPGAEPKSCVKGLDCVESKFRNPEAAQSKHHWWWQANQIFDHLTALKNFTGPVLFLEENNYVSPDILITYKVLILLKKRRCDFCEMISLAAHAREVWQYNRTWGLIRAEPWTDEMPKTAIAFDRKTWNNIKPWKEIFCLYNDSNWDRSLKRIGAEKWAGNIYLITSDAPRVFAIKDCEQNESGCNMEEEIKEIRKFIRSIAKQLFPLRIKVEVMFSKDYSGSGTGYWSDVRDHELCLHFANQNVWF